MFGLARRAALGVAAGGILGAIRPLRAETVTLPFGNGERPLVQYPEKRQLIGLTARPPQLETPFGVYDEGILTPNDAFFVRYHLADLPLDSIDPATYRLAVGGLVENSLSLSLDELKAMDSVELVAVNQCPATVAGSPTAYGGRPSRQRPDGQCSLDGGHAQGRARSTALRPEAVQVRFDGLDGPVLDCGRGRGRGRGGRGAAGAGGRGRGRGRGRAGARRGAGGRARARAGGRGARARARGRRARGRGRARARAGARRAGAGAGGRARARARARGRGRAAGAGAGAGAGGRARAGAGGGRAGAGAGAARGRARARAGGRGRAGGRRAGGRGRAARARRAGARAGARARARGRAGAGAGARGRARARAAGARARARARACVRAVSRLFKCLYFRARVRRVVNRISRNQTG